MWDLLAGGVDPEEKYQNNEPGNMIDSQGEYGIDENQARHSKDDDWDGQQGVAGEANHSAGGADDTHEYQET